MFVIINWMETVLIFYYMRRLRKTDHDQLNIKSEFQRIATVWIVFSLIYYIFAVTKFSRLGGFLLILLRDAATTLIQTGPLLYQVYYGREMEYHSDLLTKKILRLDIDTILAHKLTF